MIVKAESSPGHGSGDDKKGYKKNMVKRFRPIAVLGSVCIMLLPQCQTAESTTKFVILSHSGTCSGYYTTDSNDPIFFDVTALADGSTSYYSCTQDLDSPSSVTIHIDSSDSTTTSVTIYIYSDDTVVAKETFSPTTSYKYDSSGNLVYTSVITGDLSYTFTSSSTTATTSSSTD